MFCESPFHWDDLKGVNNHTFSQNSCCERLHCGTQGANFTHTRLDWSGLGLRDFEAMSCV